MASILVVDDEPDDRFLLKHALERAGHEVTEAYDGLSALAATRRARPSLVVTDMMMPGMSGVDLIRTLRADPDTAAIPIVSVSGNYELAVEADVVLDKYGDLSELIPAVEGLLRAEAERQRPADLK